ncbi:high affinity cGMP-specific 3',5'-cyclic phosphodiesterase 9A-like [Chiloscyllium punctatum]|uniref:high affinity cGMP-specific 3',5'-cyclic phosphodiesterase 9A-like n=1 Tax=Chiloscyllium punctatum TaxID=137246 RepID=UPI003B63CAC7
MGSGSSAAQLKAIHLDVNGKRQKVIFSCLSSRSDIRETISVAAGAFRGEPVALFDSVGNLIGIDPEMPENSERFPYKVIVQGDPRAGKRHCLHTGIFEGSSEHRNQRNNIPKSESATNQGTPHCRRH